MVRAVQSNRKYEQSSVSVSTHNQSVARLDDARPRSVAIFWHCTKRGAWTVESTGVDRRAVALCKQTFKKVRQIRDLKKKKFQNSSTPWNMLPFIKKKGKRAGLPQRVRSPRVLIHTCAVQGVGGGHNMRIETAVFFFVSVPFFFFFFERKFVKSRWFFCALCAMQLRACFHSLDRSAVINLITTSVSAMNL